MSCYKLFCSKAYSYQVAFATSKIFPPVKVRGKDDNFLLLSAL